MLPSNKNSEPPQQLIELQKLEKQLLEFDTKGDDELKNMLTWSKPALFAELMLVYVREAANFKKSTEYYHKAVKNSKNSDEKKFILYGYAKILFQIGKYSEAYTICNNALKVKISTQSPEYDLPLKYNDNKEVIALYKSLLKRCSLLNNGNTTRVFREIIRPAFFNTITSNQNKIGSYVKTDPVKELADHNAKNNDDFMNLSIRDLMVNIKFQQFYKLRKGSKPANDRLNLYLVGIQKNCLIIQKVASPYLKSVLLSKTPLHMSEMQELWVSSMSKYLNALYLQINNYFLQQAWSKTCNLSKRYYKELAKYSENLPKKQLDIGLIGEIHVRSSHAYALQWMIIRKEISQKKSVETFTLIYDLLEETECGIEKFRGQIPSVTLSQLYVCFRTLVEIGAEEHKGYFAGKALFWHKEAWCAEQAKDSLPESYKSCRFSESIFKDWIGKNKEAANRLFRYAPKNYKAKYKSNKCKIHPELDWSNCLKKAAYYALNIRDVKLFSGIMGYYGINHVKNIKTKFTVFHWLFTGKGDKPFKKQACKTLKKYGGDLTKKDHENKSAETYLKELKASPEEKIEREEQVISNHRLGHH